MKKTSINNGKKGGRPKADSKIYIKIPGINLVNLTQEQYNNLVIKYGYDLLNKSICILEDWLENNKNKSKKYLGKNHYAHFRIDGWLINTAKRKTSQVSYSK